MALLIYNSVPIVICKTLEFFTEPVQTEDGTDYQMTRTRITVQGVIGQMATTVPGGHVLVAGGGGNAGRLGQSLAQLQNFLMAPRKQLQYSVAAVGNPPDVVLVTPSAGALCDAGNGPIPRYCKVHEISGDYSAIITFSIDCYAVASNAIVLANRWQMQESLDDDFYTTVRYRGHAYFRSDLLALGGNPLAPWPDQFRWGLIPPPAATLQRRTLSVTITPDGRQMAYEVADVQQNLCLPQNFPATRLEGLITTGSEAPIKNIQDMLSSVADTSKKLLTGDWFGSFTGMLKSVTPVNKANAIIRVYGRPDALKSTLANIAVFVAIDRLSANGNTASLVSSYLTASIEKKFVELRCEAFLGLGALINSVLDPTNFATQQKLDADINVSGTTLPYDRGPCNNPPASNFTRGTYLNELVSQLLGIPDQPPSMALSIPLPDVVPLR